MFINVHCFIYCKQVTDASLLMITGFPAFAVGDESLCQQAKDMAVEKLEVLVIIKQSVANTISK